MLRTCTVCRHDNRTEIDTALIRSESLRHCNWYRDNQVSPGTAPQEVQPAHLGHGRAFFRVCKLTEEEPTLAESSTSGRIQVIRRALFLKAATSFRNVPGTPARPCQYLKAQGVGDLPVGAPLVTEPQLPPEQAKRVAVQRENARREKLATATSRKHHPILTFEDYAWLDKEG